MNLSAQMKECGNEKSGVVRGERVSLSNNGGKSMIRCAGRRGEGWGEGDADAMTL